MFWSILEFVSKSFSTLSETNWTGKACPVLSAEDLCFLQESNASAGQGIQELCFHMQLHLSHSKHCSSHALCCLVAIAGVSPQQSSFTQCSSLSTQLVLLLGNRSWRELLNYENEHFPHISPVIFLFVTHVGFLSMFELSMVSPSCLWFK